MIQAVCDIQPMQSNTNNADRASARVSAKIKTTEDLEVLRCLINEGHRIVQVENISCGYMVSLSKLAEGEREVWGESFDAYVDRVFVGIDWKGKGK